MQSASNARNANMVLQEVQPFNKLNLLGGHIFLEDVDIDERAITNNRII